MVAAYKEQRWGKAAYDRELALFAKRRDRAARAGFDVPLTYSGAYPDLPTKRAIVYAKGAQFLHVLRESMGDAAFWAGLRSYTQRHAGGVVETHDLQRALEQAHGRPLAALFDAWAYEREP
jgi:aminopeptidase N